MIQELEVFNPVTAQEEPVSDGYWLPALLPFLKGRHFQNIVRNLKGFNENYHYMLDASEKLEAIIYKLKKIKDVNLEERVDFLAAVRKLIKTSYGYWDFSRSLTRFAFRMVESADTFIKDEKLYDLDIKFVDDYKIAAISEADATRKFFNVLLDVDVHLTSIPIVEHGEMLAEFTRTFNDERMPMKHQSVLNVAHALQPRVIDSLISQEKDFFKVEIDNKTVNIENLTSILSNMVYVLHSCAFSAQKLPIHIFEFYKERIK